VEIEEGVWGGGVGECGGAGLIERVGTTWWARACDEAVVYDVVLILRNVVRTRQRLFG
jgi:hypothetical protein